MKSMAIGRRLARYPEQRPECFVIMPFDEKLVDIFDAIEDVAHGFGLECIRADLIQHSEEITPVVKDRIRSAFLIVADLSGANPNVYYEIGYAHALGKEVILIAPKEEKVLFDLRQVNQIIYGTLRELKSKLKDRVKVALERRKTEVEPPVGPGKIEVATEITSALAEVTGLIAKDPRKAELYVSRARVFRALGEYEKSLTDLAQASALDPGNVTAYVDAGYILNGLRRFEEGLSKLGKALELDPTNPKAHAHMAYTLNGMRRFEQAREAAERALEIDPTNVGALRSLEVANSFASGQGEELSQQKLAADELVSIGYGLNTNHQHQMALEAYDKAIALDQKNVEAYIQRGYTLNELARHVEALNS